MPYIYVLHFDTPLAHAEHYIGCTVNLKARLTAHANGAGANLTKVLMEQGIGWRLGALMVTTQANMRRLERTLKNIAHADRYCELCNAQAKRLPETQPYSIAAVPWQATSQALLNIRALPKDIKLRLTDDLDGEQLLNQIKWLMRADKDALGFIPAAGKQGLNVLLPKGKVAVALAGKDVLGYAAFTINFAGQQLTIHQCCVKDEVRLLGIGKRLIELVKLSYPVEEYLAKVRTDLAANHFWTAIGFKEFLAAPHPTSGNLIHHYHLQGKEV